MEQRNIQYGTNQEAVLRSIDNAGTIGGQEVEKGGIRNRKRRRQ